MSHDLTVWVADGPAAVGELARAGFAEAEGGFLLEGDDWAMTVTLGPIDDEDIPDRVRSRVAGIRHCIAMMLNATDAKVFERFEGLARRLAETGRGAVEGLEAQPWLAPTARPAGAAARRSPRPTQRVAELAMSWWFEPEALARPGMLEGLMATVARLLPEALPRRYETVEPRQRFKLAETGMDHFIHYLRTLRHPALVDPTLPCMQPSYPRGDGYGWSTWANGASR